MKRILVTGASGFVGPHMISELKRAGYDAQGVTAETCDLTNPDQCHQILKKWTPDAVIHLAAYSGYAQCQENPRLAWQINTLGVESFVRSYAMIRPEGTFLFVSTGKIYQPSKDLIDEQSSCEPADFYALTKLAADLRLKQLSSELPLTILRARSFNHAGPGQALGFICPDLVSRLKPLIDLPDDIKLELGSLSAQLDLTDVRDIVLGYRLLLEKGVNGDVINFGRGHVITVQNLVDTFSGVIGRKIKPFEKSSYDRPYTTLLRSANISLAQKTLGWKPRIVLSKTLEDLWNHE